MKMKIRTKVLLGILFIFVEFVIIGFLSMYYISSIKYGSELMIKNNYRSVHYAENMIQAIDETNTAVNSLFLNSKYPYDKNSLTSSFNIFEENLKLEENNITEFGEKELVQSIKENYFIYKSLIADKNNITTNDKINYYSINILPLTNELKTKIFSLSSLNMQSILHKNESLSETVGRIYKNLSILLTLCFILTFTFLFNFPSFISGSIMKITENIKEITNSNFKKRIEISSNDEFKELVEAINQMVEKLGKINQPIVEKHIVKIEKTKDEEQIMQNIQTLLDSVKTLVDSMSKINDNATLQKQSEIIKEIEQDLAKVVKS
jgi:nitrate/nitrite-specific signal transduction histidine kinase